MLMVAALTQGHDALALSIAGIHRGKCMTLEPCRPAASTALSSPPMAAEGHPPFDPLPMIVLTGIDTIGCVGGDGWLPQQ
jgi:hypothetical protein